jgi:iron complex transport system substrate-binding protein
MRLLPSRAVFAALLLFPIAAPGETLEWLKPSGPPAAPPSRVVSLAPSITEILFEIGAGEAVAGVTRYDDWPPQVRSIKRVGGYLDLDFETVISLRPDAVLCEPNSGIKGAVERMAGAGIHVGVVQTPDAAAIFEAVERLGEVMGRAAQGAQKAAALRSRIAAVREKVRGLDATGVIILFNAVPPMAAGPGTFADSIITLAGGRNLAADARVGYPVLDRERLLVLDPDVIIDQSEAAMSSGGNTGRPSPAITGIKGLKAVKNGRVHSMPGLYLFRPGPRVAESVEGLAAFFHPEVFARR